MAERRTRRGLGDLDPARRSRVETILARRSSPEHEEGEVADRDALAEEYRATGTIESAGDPIEAEALLELRRFVARLRDYRESQGITLVEIAERSGIDAPALSRLETGRTNPTFATLSRYARALGLVPRLDYEVAGRR
jgi:DNA-binding phage protein